MPSNGHANLSNGHISNTSKEESHPETTMSSNQRVAVSPKGIKVKQTNKYWMFLICINFIPGTESQAFRTYSFSLFYSPLPPLFWKTSPSTFLIFFFNLCSNLKFYHIKMCLKYFNIILKRKILIGRIILAVISYCELTDVDSYY